MIEISTSQNLKLEKPKVDKSQNCALRYQNKINVDHIKLLKPTSYFTHHLLWNLKILHAGYIAWMCFVWLPDQRVHFPLYIIKLLKTKRRLLYLNTQFVPRSKHFSSRS